MANSSFIGKAKNRIIKEIIKDNEIVQAIDAPDIGSPEDLVGNYVFNYHQDPYTVKKTITFLTVQVHIQQQRNWSENTIYVYPIIEIYIISHYSHMSVDNVPKITENRNDYIARLLDEKFNGYDGLGVGQIKLTSNVEGAMQGDYVFRKLTFNGTDLNDSLCEEE